MKGILPFPPLVVYGGATDTVATRSDCPFKPERLVFLPESATWFRVDAFGLWAAGNKLVQSYLPTATFAGFFSQNLSPLALPFGTATSEQEFRLKVTNISGMQGVIHALLEGYFL